MGAIAKNPSLQLLPAPVQQMPKTFLTDSQIPIRIMDLNEARQLTQFATVIVLVLDFFADDGIDLSRAGENDSLSGPPKTLKVLEFFDKATSRSKARSTDSDFEFGDVKVNFSTMEANRSGDPLTLTALEFKILKYLIENARRVISRDEMLNEVWGYTNYPTTRTVDNQVSKLRKKMERDPSRPVHFRTVHGAGYKFLP